MQERFEPREPLAVGEHRLRDLRAIGAAVGEDLRPEALDERVADVVVGCQQVMDDLVARDRRGAPGAERIERSRLAGADPTRDRDRDRAAPCRTRQASPLLLVGLVLRAGLVGCRLVGLGLIGGRFRRDLRGRRLLHLGLGNLCDDLVSRIRGFLDGLRLDRCDHLVSRNLARLAATSATTSSAETSVSSTTSTASASSSAPSTTAAALVGNASSESFRSGIEWTDSAPSARGTGTASSSTRFSESERRRRSPSTSRIRTFTGSPCETTSRGFST